MERIPNHFPDLNDWMNWLNGQGPNIIVTEHVRWLHGTKRQREVELARKQSRVVHRSRILNLFFTTAVLGLIGSESESPNFFQFRFRPNCRFRPIPIPHPCSRPPFKFKHLQNISVQYVRKVLSTVLCEIDKWLNWFVLIDLNLSCDMKNQNLKDDRRLVSLRFQNSRFSYSFNFFSIILYPWTSMESNEIIYS